MNLKKFFVGRAIGFAIILVILLVWWIVHSINEQAGSTVLKDPTVETGDYEYKCVDGAEFAMTPSEDGKSIRMMIPETSGDKFETIILSIVPTESGARYEGNGFVFFGHGETVELSNNSAATTCSPMPSDDEAPFNFGD